MAYEENNTTQFAPNETASSQVGPGKIKERLSSQATEVGERVTRTVDKTRERASDKLRAGSKGLEAFGEQLSSRFDVAREKTYSGLRSTSRSLERVADYLDETDARSMMDTTCNVIRQYPGKSLLIGLVLGAVVGRLVSRR